MVYETTQTGYAKTTRPLPARILSCAGGLLLPTTKFDDDVQLLQADEAPMIMTSLQNFINRRATSRTSAPAVARAESPSKQLPQSFNVATGSSSNIPLAAGRVPSRSTNYSRQQPAQLRDDSDDFKDSEILSLENQDGEEYDDDEELDEQGNYLGDFDRDEVGGRYLVNNKNGVALNGQGYNVGGDVYRWQNTVMPPDSGQQSDEESDGRLTPKILIADEAATERARSPVKRDTDTDQASEQLHQEQFYTSLEFEPAAIGTLSDGTEDVKVENNIVSNGGQTWEDIDREYTQQTKRPTKPVRFSVSGLLDTLKDMGVPLRGSERILLYDQIPHYKVFSIVNPTLPYQILIPYDHNNQLEPLKMQSEIATIAFIRRNAPSIPTPEIAYHNLDLSNPAQAPFLVIRALKGRSVSSLDGGVSAALKDRKRCASLLDGLARVQAQVMKSGAPSNLPIDRIGNIFFKQDAKKPKQSFVIGPYLAAEEDTGNGLEATAPITDLPDLCMQVFQSTESNSLSSSRKGSHKEIRLVKRRLAGLLGLLPPLPKQYSNLTLFHNSLGISSVLVDPATFSITCVLDFRDVFTVPMALTPIYPAEIRPPNSEWSLWIEDQEGKAVDKYWGLRSIYETRLAKYDARFAGDLWDDEELGDWLRIWEVVNEGVEGWVKKRRWIEAELERVKQL